MILLVEDEWLIAEGMASLLRENGYVIAGPASSVISALQILDRAKPHAAILDISLGAGEDSFPVARRLAATGVPFAFMTGYSHTNLPAEFQHAALVSKPASAEDLKSTLACLLRGPLDLDKASNS